MESLGKSLRASYEAGVYYEFKSFGCLLSVE